MGKKIKLIFLLTTALISIQCSRNLESINFDIVKYKKIGENYHYSDLPKKFDNNTYEPVITEKYRNGKLSGIDLYKSEGALSYSITEINNDLPLKKLLKLKDKKQISITKDKINNHGKIYKISTIVNDSIFCCLKDSLVIFIYK